MEKKYVLPEGFNVEERVEKAKRLFTEGYNCCQSVVLAFDDVIGLDRELLAAMTSGFGGGVGRQREVCGCVSGMTFLTGFICPAADPSIKEDRTANYALVQELCGIFKAECGSIICKELLGLVPMGSGAPVKKENPEPSDRTPEYYRKRPCVETVALAARIVSEKLLA